MTTKKSVRFSPETDDATSSSDQSNSMSAEDARAMFRSSGGTTARAKDTRNLTFSSRFREAGAMLDDSQSSMIDEKQPLLPSKHNQPLTSPEDKVS